MVEEREKRERSDLRACAPNYEFIQTPQGAPRPGGPRWRDAELGIQARSMEERGRSKLEVTSTSCCNDSSQCIIRFLSRFLSCAGEIVGQRAHAVDSKVSPTQDYLNLTWNPQAKPKPQAFLAEAE